MAGSLVSDFSVGDTNLDNIMLTLNKAYKGFMALSLTEMDSTTVPAIAAGSWAEDNGALFKFDAEEAISTTDPVTSSTVADGVVFVCLVPSASTITAAFTATSPTWSDSKQGFYGTGDQANYRYVAACYKDSSEYISKNIVEYDWWINEAYIRYIYESIATEVTHTGDTAKTTPATTFSRTLPVKKGFTVIVFYEADIKISSAGTSASIEPTVTGDFYFVNSGADDATFNNPVESEISLFPASNNTASYLIKSCWLYSNQSTIYSPTFLVVDDCNIEFTEFFRTSNSSHTVYMQNRKLLIKIISCEKVSFT